MLGFQLMRSSLRINSFSGFTLIELIVAITVLAILATLAVPNITDLIRNNRVTSQNNELVAMLNFARNESLRRNDQVPVNLTALADGWSGEVLSPDGDADTQGCTVGVLRCASYDNVSLNANVSLTFNRRGYLTNFQNVTLYLQHQGCTGERQRQRIEIRPTGQVNSCSVPCDDTETQCN